MEEIISLKRGFTSIFSKFQEGGARMKKKGWDDKEECYYDDEIEDILLDELDDNDDEEFDEDAYFENLDEIDERFAQSVLRSSAMEKWEKLMMYNLAVERGIECIAPPETEEDLLLLPEEKRQKLREEALALLRGEKEINDEAIQGALDKARESGEITEKVINSLMVQLAWYYFNEYKVKRPVRSVADVGFVSEEDFRALSKEVSEKLKIWEKKLLQWEPVEM
ncbi:MAG: hypothetical protein QW607_11690 [Desulfurococcaceae archaeon]